MTEKSRYLATFVKEDLKQKMVFISGPRQVGKTTFALSFLKSGNERDPGYLNWDFPVHRRALLAGQVPTEPKLLVLDEVHKFLRWKTLVKGIHDVNRSHQRIIVTGSARLDVFRRGGDSLQGRYHAYRLHPLSLAEINSQATAKDVQSLLKFGGFPEPFFAGSDRALRRWQLERNERLVREDIRDLERVRDLTLLELLLVALPAKVGSPLSIKSLREDLQVSHEAVANWLEIFERFYTIFMILPFGSPRIRAVKKEKKLYFWDWSAVPGPGERFENLVASQLLKYCHLQEDTEGYKMELRYIRDTDKREVDFVVLKNRMPLFAVECKSGDRQVSPHIGYFKARTNIPAFYQVHLGTRDYLDTETGTRVLPFQWLVKELGLP